MSRTSREDPLDKFRFRVAFAEGTTTALEADGKTTKLDPQGTPISSSTFASGFHDFQMPKRTTAKGTYREGNNPTVSQIFAGLSTMEDVVLSKGVYSPKLASGATSQTYNNDFYGWAQAVHSSHSTDGTFNLTGVDYKNSSSSKYKKDLCIVMYTRDNKPARAWLLYNAFPTHFVPGSDLNASEDGEKSMESLTIAYEDFDEISTADLLIQ